MLAADMLNALPMWWLAGLIIGASVVFSVGLQLLVRAIIGVDAISSNQEVAGFKYAVVGVAYAVLLAFVVIGVWEQYEDTDDAVHAEAQRFYNLFRNSYNFSESQGENIRTALVAYAVSVRDDDWPAMVNGVRGSEDAADALANLSYTVGQTKSEDIALLPSVLHNITLMQEIADIRLERLSDVAGHITEVIWIVLILGGAITLAYPAFFATKKPIPQSLMTAGLAVIVGAIFFLSISLNFPFAGRGHIGPEPINDIIERMREERARGGL